MGKPTITCGYVQCSVGSGGQTAWVCATVPPGPLATAKPDESRGVYTVLTVRIARATCSIAARGAIMGKQPGLESENEN